jgi:hypothetical protein
MRPAKQIVFRYNDDPTTQLLSARENDGGFQVKVETDPAEPFEVPVHRVFLTNK